MNFLLSGLITFFQVIFPSGKWSWTARPIVEIEAVAMDCASIFSLTLCLNARQPGKVLNGPNARQSEIFTEFPLKDSFKLLDGTYLMFLSKNCVCVQDDEITKLLHCYYKITGGLYDCRSRSQID